jgi:hypothetical protein
VAKFPAKQKCPSCENSMGRLSHLLNEEKDGWQEVGKETPPNSEGARYRCLSGHYWFELMTDRCPVEGCNR